MNIPADKKLFWFLKDNVSLDISKPDILEMYVQQVLSRGRAQDVKFLLTTIKFEQFKEVFLRIKRFLAWEVRKFWEDFIENH